MHCTYYSFTAYCSLTYFFSRTNRYMSSCLEFHKCLYGKISFNKPNKQHLSTTVIYSNSTRKYRFLTQISAQFFLVYFQKLCFSGKQAVSKPKTWESLFVSTHQDISGVENSHCFQRKYCTSSCPSKFW